MCLFAASVRVFWWVRSSARHRHNVLHCVCSVLHAGEPRQDSGHHGCSSMCQSSISSRMLYKKQCVHKVLIRITCSQLKYLEVPTTSRSVTQLSPKNVLVPSSKYPKHKRRFVSCGYDITVKGSEDTF